MLMDKCHMSYKRIMVAVDGSETSDLALNEAIQLTKALHSQQCILHVAKEFPATGADLGIDLERYQEIIRSDGQAILEKAKDLAKREGVFVEIQLVEVSNAVQRISENIIKATRLWKADLLVIGTHGRSGFNRLIMGSVAEETLRTAQIPILLIRAKEQT
jgi:nucleotide-binding universal stress UspA family protein